MLRAQVITRLAGLIVARGPGVRVGIDGRCGSGKSRLAEELATCIRSMGHDVLLASVDAFHHPPEHRYRQGELSAQGYFEDAFDYASVAQFADSVPASAILLFDGVFLFRREIDALWHFRILVDVDAETAIARAVQRDSGRLGPAELMRLKYRVRYEPAWGIYEQLEKPHWKAQAIVDNRELEWPEMSEIH